MLDENLEYNNYTHAPTDNTPPCLRYVNLSNHLSGIEHAMTTVARGFLFADKNATAPIGCTKAFLRSWCGLPRRSAIYYCLVGDRWERTDRETVEIKNLKTACRKNCLGECIYIEMKSYDKDGSESWGQIANQFPNECFGCCNTCKREESVRAVINWLPSYIWMLQGKKFDALEKVQQDAAEKLYRQLFPALQKEEDSSTDPTEAKEFSLSEKAKEIFPLLYELYNKRTQFSRHIFHTSITDTGKANNKEITYERIIANGLNAGPLQTYTLYTNKEISNVETLFNGITKVSAKKENKTLGKTNQPLILAIAAVYLMKKKANQNYVVFNTPACTNWLQGNLPNGGISIFRYNNEPLFYKNIVAGNVIKLCVNATWLKDMGLGVCPADQIPENVTVISYKYKKNNSKTGNNWDLVFEIGGIT